MKMNSQPVQFDKVFTLNALQQNINLYNEKQR